MAITKRLRTDLTEFAVARELSPGTLPAVDTFRQVGLITGGVTLPDPNYEWEPYYGVGVSDRNYLFPVQGRHQFQGSIPSIYLTHAESRFLLEMLMGVAYNTADAKSATITYNPSTASSGTKRVVTAGAPSGTPAAGSPATHIITGSVVGQTQPSWAYLGTQNGVRPFRTRNLSYTDDTNNTIGWFGKEPKTASTFTIHAINTINYDADTTVKNKIVAIRQSIVQPTFSIGAKFFTDFGDRFNRVYTGFKINRATINLEEGRPVTMNVDFQGTGLVHDLGGSVTMPQTATRGSTIADVPRYSASTPDFTFAPISSQPYFFSTAEVKFLGTTFGRFRSLSIEINNQPEALFYVDARDGQGNLTASEIDARQSPNEILEGRRAITIRGTLDGDGTALGGNASNATFFEQLLQQGRSRTVANNNLIGLSLEITLQVKNTESSMESNAIKIIVPGSLGTAGMAISDADANIQGKPNTGNGNNSAFRTDTGLILRAAPHPISAPPAIAVPVEMEGMAASCRFEVLDRVTTSNI